MQASASVIMSCLRSTSMLLRKMFEQCLLDRCCPHIDIALREQQRLAMRLEAVELPFHDRARIGERRDIGRGGRRQFAGNRQTERKTGNRAASLREVARTEQRAIQLRDHARARHAGLACQQTLRVDVRKQREAPRLRQIVARHQRGTRAFVPAQVRQGHEHHAEAQDESSVRARTACRCATATTRCNAPRVHGDPANSGDVGRTHAERPDQLPVLVARHIGRDRLIEPPRKRFVLQPQHECRVPLVRLPAPPQRNEWRRHFDTGETGIRQHVAQ
jgi:hypothetical protein